MTNSEITAALAEQVGITKKQVKQFFQAQARLAYQEAKNQFIIPGIGKLKVNDRPARDMVVPFGPKAGQTIRIPPSQKLKFTIAKAAKDAILGSRK